MLKKLSHIIIASYFFSFLISTFEVNANQITTVVDITGSSKDVSAQLKPTEQYQFKMMLQSGDFVRGQLESSQTLASFALLDANGQLIRELINLDKKSSRFLFNVAKNSEYQIVIKSKDIDTKVEIHFNQRISQAEQGKFIPIPESATIAKLQQNIKAGKNTDTFWQKIIKQGTPLVEPKDENNSLVTFLWRGAKNNVRLFGAPFGGHKELTHLENSDVWYSSYVLPNSTRLSYQLAPDVPQIPGSARERKVAILATAQSDPYNKSPWSITANNDKFNKESTLVLNKASKQPWIIPSSSPKGTIKHYRFDSKILNNSREISIYTPANFGVTSFSVTKPEVTNVESTNQKQALLFVFDAVAYQSKVPTPQILDNLIAAQKILPTIAVFISNPSAETRAIELPCNSDFADFLAQELLPFVKRKTQSNASVYNTILSGSSYGGLASAYIAFKYPQYFGGVLSQSGSFWWSPRDNEGHLVEDQWLTRQYAQAAHKEIRFYFNAGLFETNYFSIDILESNRHFRDILTAKGYSFTYQEHANGHDYLSWRGTMANGLIDLLGQGN